MVYVGSLFRGGRAPPLGQRYHFCTGDIMDGLLYHEFSLDPREAILEMKSGRYSRSEGHRCRRAVERSVWGRSENGRLMRVPWAFAGDEYRVCPKPV